MNGTTLRTTERSLKLINFTGRRRCLERGIQTTSTSLNKRAPLSLRQSILTRKPAELCQPLTRGTRIRLPSELLRIRLSTSTDELKPPKTVEVPSLLNPNKPDAIDLKDQPVEPIIPLTYPRFPKNTGEVPSVTRVLQATMPAASQFLLDRWKESMIKKLGVAGFNKYQRDTFERGRALHALLANYLLGKGEPTSDAELSTEIVCNLWKSIESVIREKISNVRLVEHIVTHPSMKYRGIVDCVAFYNDELVVIDFKTAEKPKKNVESLYDNPLQVTAYCGAINNDESIPRHVIDRNICSGLVIVAYIDGSTASIYHLNKDQVAQTYWKQWAMRLDQYSRLEELKQEPAKESKRIVDKMDGIKK